MSDLKIGDGQGVESGGREGFGEGQWNGCGFGGVLGGGYWSWGGHGDGCWNGGGYGGATGGIGGGGGYGKTPPAMEDFDG